MKAIICLLCLLCAAVTCSGQGKITGIKTLLTAGDHDTQVLVITPNSFDATSPDSNKSYEVYGALICYQLNGEQKALRQDMTGQLKEKGKYTITLGYAKTSKVTNVEVEFIDLTQPRSSWPEKTKCFE